MDIHGFIKKDQVDLPGLSAWLDGLPGAERIAQSRALTGMEQAALFHAAKGYRPIDLEHFVPRSVEDGRPVIHYGRNSLPVFSLFEKRFCRPNRSSVRLAGYNEQSLRAITGPGYFSVRAGEAGEVVIDYRELPPEKPAGWPEIAPNSRGLSRLVYYGMQDFMRGVSRHVSIGRANKGGKMLDNWFVLCREDAD